MYLAVHMNILTARLTGAIILLDTAVRFFNPST